MQSHGLTSPCTVLGRREATRANCVAARTTPGTIQTIVPPWGQFLQLQERARPKPTTLTCGTGELLLTCMSPHGELPQQERARPMLTTLTRSSGRLPLTGRSSPMKLHVSAPPCTMLGRRECGYRNAGEIPAEAAMQDINLAVVRLDVPRTILGWR